MEQCLGAPRYLSDEVNERELKPGVAVGLVWTPVGGDIIFIETAAMPGRGELVLTGQLGDVMKESARAALSYLRMNSIALGIDPDLFQKTDIHIHVPAGAIPKDGPSAGVTILTAMTSLFTGQILTATFGNDRGNYTYGTGAAGGRNKRKGFGGAPGRHPQSVVAGAQ